MLSYNDFELSSLGDVEITQERVYEGGEAPQRARVSLKICVHLFQRTLAENYDLVLQARAALSSLNGTLVWENDETGEEYINQTVANQSEELPEEWQTYYEKLELKFFYYDQSLDTSEQNIPMTFVRTGSTVTCTFNNVEKWTESANVSRFDTKRSQRKETIVKLRVSGLILGDTTLTIAQRQAAFGKLVQQYRAEIMNSAEGTLTFGAGQQQMFNRVVRIDDFDLDVNNAINAVPFSFTAHYTLFPDESGYATVEATAEESDPQTGEFFLMLSGKIQASDLVTAQAKLDNVVATLLAGYGYGTATTATTTTGLGGGPTLVTPYALQPGAVQPGGGGTGSTPQPTVPNSQKLEFKKTPNFISANADGDTFTELNFSGRWRRWSAQNQKATFTPTGSKTPVAFGNVRLWSDSYRAERFDVMRSERRDATGAVSGTGTWAVSGSMALADRRKALLAQQRAMKSAVNCADGTLAYGDWSQAGVKIEDLTAEINQAVTGIDWTFRASYVLFPNEGGYATCEFSADVRDDIETGDEVLVFNGSILAPTGSLARAKLTSLRNATLSIYGFVISQQIRAGSQSKAISANGDTTTGINEGLEMGGDVAGVSFIQLTFNEEYRRRIPGQIISSTFQINSREDRMTGILLTTYSGRVTASGPNANAAMAAAIAQAMVLGAKKEPQIDSTAFLKQSTLNISKRQTQLSNNVEFISVEFSYEYQSQIEAGKAYMEMTTEMVSDAYGPNSQNVRGFIVARDFPTAQGLYQAQVIAPYNAQLIRNESVSQMQVQAQNDSGTVVEQLKLEFSFTALSNKPTGLTTAKYSINIQRDFLALRRHSRIAGSVFSLNSATATAYINTLLNAQSLGEQVAYDSNEDHEYTSDAGSNGLDMFIKLDFEARYADSLKGIAGILESRVTESITYSGTRWAVQQMPYDVSGANGYSIPQPAGEQEGSRVVRGSVTAGSLATAQAWAYQQKALLTGDSSGGFYPQPDQVQNDFQFAPRVDGIVYGANSNVELYRVTFTFSEILPNYPSPVPSPK